MKKIVQSSIILSMSCFFFFLYSSCEKAPILEECTGIDCIIFEGQVYDSNNNIFIQDAFVEVEFDESSAALFSDDRTTVGRTYSDENGFFRFSIPGEDYKVDNGYFIIIVRKDNYYTRYKYFYQVDSTNFDIPISADVEIKTKAELELSIKTSSGIENFNYFLPNDTYTKTLYVWLRDSTNIDLTNVYKVPGDQFVKIDYEYEKDGNDYTASDSVFIAGGEKGSMEIVIE
jgi:hypothetical protein